jgi:transcriptional regulator with XRE-family HTH domain
LQELGNAIRRARRAKRLTQADLAAAAGVSRTTMNQLESGLVPDLGIQKVYSILNQLGLELSVRPAMGKQRPDFVRMASTAASVSFKDVLTEDELVRALLSGKIAQAKRPHFRVLLEEANPELLKGLVEEVGQWSRPGRVKKNLAKIAHELGSTRGISEWMTNG